MCVLVEANTALYTEFVNMFKGNLIWTDLSLWKILIQADTEVHYVEN